MGKANTLLYRLFLPPGHDEPEASFPLVLFLHGSGQIGTDNIEQLAYVDGLVAATQSERFASYLLAPQVQPGQGGWGSLTRGMTLQVLQQIEQQYAVNSERRYVTGLSMGGFGTWNFLEENPDTFEAAVPMSSWGDPNQADQYLQTRLWSFHGRNDSLLAQYDRETILAIQEAGGSPLYTETNGGHDIWGPIYDDPNSELYAWMFEGTQPSMATFNYDPQTGSVKIDASVAPGGAVNIFKMTFATDVFSLPATIVVDGTTVETTRFLRRANENELFYDDRNGPGFSVELDLGPILPVGLDYVSLHDVLVNQVYASPATGRAQRLFSLVIAVPEPSTRLLFCCVAVMMVARGKCFSA